MSRVSVSGRLRWRSVRHGVPGAWQEGQNRVVQVGVAWLLGQLIAPEDTHIWGGVVCGTSASATEYGATATIQDAVAATVESADSGGVSSGQAYVVLDWVLDETQGNGLHIQEAGWLLSDGRLFARRLVPFGLKTADDRIEGQWVLALRAN